MTPTESLIRVLSDCARRLGMGNHSYIVGGAPRDFALGIPVKDVDVVVEPRGDRTAAALAKEVALNLGGLPCHPDAYGVCHIGPVPTDIDFHGVSLKGQKVEIVSARKEKYDRTRRTGSHKPVEVAPGTIEEDLARRDFTINTLTWRLGDLSRGPGGAPIHDHLLGGLLHLRAGLLKTPLDPHETFDDDPSRMLRAVRFAVKLDCSIDPITKRAIQDRAEEIRRLPYEAIDPLFFDKILTMEPLKVRTAVALMDHLGLLRPVIDLIPTARMRRAIQERIKDVGLLLFLASWGMDVGIKFEGNQLKHLLEASALLSEERLAEFFQRFQHPIDVKRFMQETGVSGPALGIVVANARDLVLQGKSPETVFDTLSSMARFGDYP